MDRAQVLEQDWFEFRQHRILEILAYEGSLTLVQLPFVDQIDTNLPQLPEQVLVGFFELLLQFEYPQLDGFQQLGELRRRVRPRNGGQTTHLRHPHPEKLIQVIGENPQIAQALNDRHLAVLGFLQYPGIEGKPAQFPGYEEMIVQIAHAGIDGINH